MIRKSRDKYNVEYLERQLHNLSKLVEINRIINSTLDIGKLLTIIMEMIKDIMKTEASTLLLYDEDTDDLVFKVALSDVGDALQEKYRVKVGQGIAGWVARERKSIYVNDVYKDDRFEPDFDRKTGFTTRAILCAPLLFKGKLLGVIQAINPVSRPEFTDEDMNLFRSFADQAALAVQNAIFFQNALEEVRIKHELTAAHSIQESLHPAVQQGYGKVSLAARSLPAREVGGEFYEIINFDDNSLGIALGDIRAKGIPGALYASLVNGALKALTGERGPVVGPVVKRLNDLVRQHAPVTDAVSFFYGIIEPAAQNMTFMNTGVAYPILVRNNQARYLKFSSKPLGGETVEAKKVRVKFQQGDMLVIITDGIVHLKNRNAQLMGLKRVMDRCEKAHQTPADIIDALLDMANDFTEGLEQREDISIIALKVEG